MKPVLSFAVDNPLISGETPLKAVQCGRFVPDARQMCCCLPQALNPNPCQAHSSMLQPEPIEPLSLAPDAAEHDDQDTGEYLAHLASTLAAHGGGSASADLALDLVLNEIVEQARLATTATAAVIALLQEGEMVCRATTGPNAPGLGVRLAMNSDLSGACIKTREAQRCDDTETDSRVVAAAYRDLEIRSILMVPLLNGDKLLGLFDILSPCPNAFGERDIQTLQALSRRILRTLQQAAETASSSLPVPVASEPLPISDESHVEAHTVPLIATFESRSAKVPRLDYWTSILSVIVVALALLLGWMLGRTGWQSAPTPPLQSAVASRPPAPQNTPPNLTSKISSEPVQTIGDASSSSSVAPGPSQSKRGSGLPSDAGLVVYEKGKVVFRSSPSPLPDASSPAPVRISPEIAAAYLGQRVEPEYPDAARQQQVQGSVVMDAVIDQSGAVRDVKIVSGDSRLAGAAANAVRQWQFKPYEPNGYPVEFETRIMIRFTLP